MPSICLPLDHRSYVKTTLIDAGDAQAMVVGLHKRPLHQWDAGPRPGQLVDACSLSAVVFRKLNTSPTLHVGSHPTIAILPDDGISSHPPKALDASHPGTSCIG